MLRHILLPLDGSQLAEEAIESARAILPQGASITLLTALSMPENWLYGADPLIVFSDYRRTLDQMEEAAKAYLERIADELRSEGFQVQTLTKYGQAAPAIMDTAASLKVDAIIMSTHGRSGISRWLFGSITNKVLTAPPCPVLVVPSHQKERAANEPVSEMQHT